jgi:hypothetical protein
MTSHQSNPVIEVDRVGLPQERYQCPQLQESCDDHSSTMIGYDDHSYTSNQAEPAKCPGSLSVYGSSSAGNIVTDDQREVSNSTLATEACDPSAIFALQEQLFNSVDHPDNILQTGSELKAHLRTASLKVNGFSQQKLPIILTYIKKKKVDILTIQDTRLDDKDSQLIAMLIRKHFENCNIQTQIASVPSDIKRADRVGG